MVLQRAVETFDEARFWEGLGMIRRPTDTVRWLTYVRMLLSVGESFGRVGWGDEVLRG